MPSFVRPCNRRLKSMIVKRLLQTELPRKSTLFPRFYRNWRVERRSPLGPHSDRALGAGFPTPPALAVVHKVTEGLILPDLTVMLGSVVCLITIRELRDE